MMKGEVMTLVALPDCGPQSYDERDGTARGTREMKVKDADTIT